MALAELLRKADAEPDVDTLREGVRVMTQALMELEVAQHLGAERYQRSPDRQGERNGYRDRTWDTRVGTLELRVPRVRDGSFFPGLLEPRKRAERALVATVREAYVQGVSTRRVDDLVKALGLKGAIAAVFQGASWQRCRTHFMRNALCLVPKGTQQMVAATIRTVFVQPDAATAREQWRRVADQLRARFPRVAQLLDEAEDEVLAYLAFPPLCRYRHNGGYAARPVMP